MKLFFNQNNQSLINLFCMNKKKIRKYEEMKLDDYQVKLLPMANLYPTLILDHTL